MTAIPDLSGPYALHSFVGRFSREVLKTAENCGYLSPDDKVSRTNRTVRAPQTRIIDAEPAQIGEFPWAVTIFHKFREGNKHMCDGVLINGTWVLTVRHCVTRYVLNDRLSLGLQLTFSLKEIL